MIAAVRRGRRRRASRSAVAATLAVVRRRDAGTTPRRRRHVTGDAGAPRWSDVVDRLSLGVVVSGSSGLVHYRNRAARALDGHPHGRARRRRRRAHAAGGPRRRGVAARRSSSTARRGSPSSCGPRRSTGGGAVATIEDVSERRRVDAVRTDFVANISHELKTPVGALAVLAETMADEDDLGVVHRVAARMIDEAHRVSRTIDDLLELSRIELGEEPVRDVVDVARRRRGRRRARRARWPRPARSTIEVLERRRRRPRARRPPPARVGARQPRRERRQVQRGRVVGAGAGARRGRVGRADGRRPRHRHPGPGPRPDLRALLPRRQGPQPRHRRHRARAGDRAPRRHQPPRRGAGVVAGGRGLDVRAAHPAAPASIPTPPRRP